MKNHYLEKLFCHADLSHTDNFCWSVLYSIVNNYWILCNRNNNWNICNTFILAGSKTLRHTTIRTMYKVITKSSCQGHAPAADLYNNLSKTLVPHSLHTKKLGDIYSTIGCTVMELQLCFYNWEEMKTWIYCPKSKQFKKRDCMQFIFLKINHNTKPESRQFCYEQSLCLRLPCVVITWIKRFCFVYVKILTFYNQTYLL